MTSLIAINAKNYVLKPHSIKDNFIPKLSSNRKRLQPRPQLTKLVTSSNLVKSEMDVRTYIKNYISDCLKCKSKI